MTEMKMIRVNNRVKQTTLILLGIFAALLVLFTLKPDLLTGDVGLQNLRVVSTEAKMPQYIPLEPDAVAALGVATPSFNGSKGPFFTSTAFIATLGFIAILVAMLGFVWKKLIQQRYEGESK